MRAAGASCGTARSYQWAGCHNRGVKVVVSGASGLVGSALLPALDAAGHDVIRLVRRPAEAANELEWDPDAGELDGARLAGVDGAITLSGANLDRRWTAAGRAEILESRVVTAGLLARTLAVLDPRPSVFVTAGGSGIYGDRGDEILTEESELGSGFLADVGRACERAAEPAREAGIRVVNVRGGVVLSRDGGALGRMLTPFRLGLGGRVGSGRQWWSWAALDDVVAAYVFVLENEVSGPVNLTSPNPVPNAQFVKALGRALGRPTVFPFPAIAVKTVFGAKGEAVLLESQRMLPATLLDAGFSFAYPQLDAALVHALER
jgi:uncharacterized protein (TIGR01777 family)